MVEKQRKTDKDDFLDEYDGSLLTEAAADAAGRLDLGVVAHRLGQLLTVAELVRAGVGSHGSHASTFTTALYHQSSVISRGRFTDI